VKIKRWYIFGELMLEWEGIPEREGSMNKNISTSEE
jgi:hypothetical protein